MFRVAQFQAYTANAGETLTSFAHHSTTHRFTVIFEKEDEGGYDVFCPTLPGCHTQSETVEEGIDNIREAIQLYVETLIEDGLPYPGWSLCG